MTHQNAETEGTLRESLRLLVDAMWHEFGDDLVTPPFDSLDVTYAQACAVLGIPSDRRSPQDDDHSCRSCPHDTYGRGLG